MLFDQIKPLDKLKQYEAFNDPTNIFTQNVDVNDFVKTNREAIESQILPVKDKPSDDFAKVAVESDDLLSRVDDLKAQSQFNPTPSKSNPFPYLQKPIVNLAKYDTDPIAKNVIKEIDDSGFSKPDSTYLKLLGARESDFRKNAGKGSYKGIYQFNKDALHAVGLNMEDYLKDTKVQFKAALKYRDNNLKELKNFQDYIGKTKDGILITKNGLGAAAHLLGAGTVKDYLSGTKNTKLAQNGFVDGNGTHITEYLKMFANN